MPATISTQRDDEARRLSNGPALGVGELLLGLGLGHGLLHRSRSPTTSRHRTRATLVGMSEDQREARAERPAPPRPLADRPARSWCWSAARCSRSATTTARAPTCGRAATPTSPRWSRPESDEYDDAPGARSPTSTPRSSSSPSRSTTRTVTPAPGARSTRSPGPAGLEPVAGPGVTVTLSDAPEDADRAGASRTTTEPNRLVVHQQDIQAVVNAMWQGGAEAITLQGQRIVSTTGIKCEGNAVPAPGRALPPALRDLGDRRRRRRSRRRSTATPGVARLPQRRRRPEHPGRAGDLESEDRVEAPAYDGLLDLSYAEPIG